MSLVLLFAFFPEALRGQASAGTISGTVRDESGSVLPGATVTITNSATGLGRTSVTGMEGSYSAVALPSGRYEVWVEAPAFRTVMRNAPVLAGTTTTVNIVMSVGSTKEVVTVDAAAAQMSYESHSVQGVVTRENIQDLPLNGRSFLQLAQLEPGVMLTIGGNGFGNQNWNVSVLGGATGKTYYTIDGGSINDGLAGGAAMNFSQEVVQEFQLSLVNFDVSTGITSTGAINIVTRSGTNDFHGSAYFFYRDHNMAAYPALKRNPLDPSPFFARRNPGLWLSGPIMKNRIFFFYNYEHMNQTQAVTYQPDLAAFAAIGGVFASPFIAELQTARVDYRHSDKNNLFFRYSHDGNHTFGLYATTAANPSTWTDNKNQANDALIGLTSALKPSIVNDFRLSWFYWHNTDSQSLPDQCQTPCVGAGLPPVVSAVGSTNFTIGGQDSNPQGYVQRRFDLSDTLAWQKGSHRMKFGSDTTFQRTFNLWQWCTPLCTDVYSPENVQSTVSAAALAQYFPTLPSSVSSNADILNLPVYNITAAQSASGIGFGSGYAPSVYDHAQELWSNRPRWYAQDVWKIRPNLTVTLGLAYQISFGLFNSDIPLPAYLAPIFGANNLHPTETNYNNVEPSLGFAWSPGASGRTVIRGGAGVYWDANILNNRAQELGAVSPLGNGRQAIGANVLSNTFPGIVEFVNGQIVPLPIGASLPLNTLTNLTLGQFMQIFNSQYPALSRIFGGGTPVPASGPFSVAGIDVSKQGVSILPPNFPLQHSYQTSIGVQRDFGHDMVLTADYARRIFVNVGDVALDLNHYSEFINGARSPVIPVCPASGLYTVGVECSNGAITVFTSEGRAVYNGLLMKLSKRLSNDYQFVASYAYQTDYSTSVSASTTFNLNNYFASYGDILPHHNLNVAGIVRLPRDFELSVNSSMISQTPFSAVVPNVDLTGTTGLSNPIPGLAYNCFNDSCGKSQLASAVAAFNSTYAGAKTPNGTTVPSLVLPPNYGFGSPIITQDLRIGRTFTLKEHYQFKMFAELFNALNVSNLTGYSNVLDTVKPTQTFAFGQPTARVVQTFGSGGPRALQVGARISF